MSSYKTYPVAPSPHGLSTSFVKHFPAVVIIVLFCSVPAAAQSMGTNYSDIWLVGYNQPYTDSDGYLHVDESYPPGANVQACEITDGSYSSYSHSYSMNATIAKVGGSMSQSSGGGYNYVRVDLGMPFDSFDGVTFYANHQTSGYCPGSNSNHVIGGAGSSRIWGISYSVYKKPSKLTQAMPPTN